MESKAEPYLFFSYSDIVRYMAEVKKDVSQYTDEQLIEFYGATVTAQCTFMDLISMKYFTSGKLTPEEREQAEAFFILNESDNFWRV